MVPFLLAAVASDGSVTFDSNAPASTDFWIGPQRYGAAKVFGTEDAVAGTDTRANGLRYTSEGVIRVYDATSAVPAGATTLGGFAVTSDGQLCVSTDAVASATFVGGIAVRSDGAVFATGLSTPRSIADAIITALTPAAWYRNATDVVSSGGFASIWADYASSDVGLVLPGVAGNYASKADSSTFGITGDVDIAIKVALNDWTPAGIQTLVAIDDNGANRNIIFYVDTAGKLQLYTSANGTTLRSALSSVATGVTDGATKWIRFTRASASGDVKFYTSDDGAAWTQLGTTQSTTAEGINSSTQKLEIGTNANGTSGAINGKVYRAILKNVIGGTAVFDADFSSQAIGAGSFTESSSNAATVTINTSGAAPAHIGKARDLLQGTGTNQPAYAAGVFTFDGVDNYLKTGAFTLAQPTWIVTVVKQITYTVNDFISDGLTASTGGVYQSSTSPSVSMYDGTAAITTPSFPVNEYIILTEVHDGASSKLQVNDIPPVTGNPGTASMGGLTLGAQGSNINFGNIAVKEKVVFDFAPTSGQIASVINAYELLFSLNLTGNNYFAEGDSITSQVSPQSYFYLFRANASPVIMGANFAVSGSTLATMSARASTTDAGIPANKHSRTYTLSVLIGTNDLVGYSGGATQYAADIATYCAARKAAGWDYIVLCTLLPSTSVGFNTQRNLLNAIFTGAGWAAANSVDAICDFGADATMGPDAAASDITYYLDGTHPTLVGYGILETILRATVQAL